MHSAPAPILLVENTFGSWGAAGTAEVVISVSYQTLISSIMECDCFSNAICFGAKVIS